MTKPYSLREKILSKLTDAGLTSVAVNECPTDEDKPAGFIVSWKTGDDMNVRVIRGVITQAKLDEIIHAA